ncbi:hypothetical protein DKX38_005695 [Salix brachista]|uniref:Serine-threonine/tyrosine-protein kinase catalytic domain-containing protein n=1 Tax=Salix brachista TaxID=2182728 RepID=A0A5N5N139_9ROSI|nr:hypothetical protein DKX38_005695 [Salix brachista]
MFSCHIHGCFSHGVDFFAKLWYGDHDQLSQLYSYYFACIKRVTSHLQNSSSLIQKGVVSFLNLYAWLQFISESQKERKMPVLAVVVASALAFFLLVMGIICWKFYFRDKFREEQGTLKSNIWTLIINGQRDLMTMASGGGVRAPEPKLQNGSRRLPNLKGLDMKTGSREYENWMHDYVLQGELSDAGSETSVLKLDWPTSNSSYNPADENVCLLDWAFVLQKRGSLMEMVDPKLRPDEFNKVEAEKVMKVALLCANASPTLRPTMAEVVIMLEGQTSIQEVISDRTIYGGDFQVHNVNDLLKQALDQSLTSCISQDHISSSDKTWNVSTSTSSHDLYPPSPESIILNICESSSSRV